MGDWKKCLKERSIFCVKHVTVCKEAIPPQAMINNLEMDAPFEELNIANSTILQNCAFT